MPDWAKILTLIIALTGWSATVAATLWQGKIPDLGTLGIPAALILALAPPLRIGRRGAETEQTEQPAGAETEASAP